MVGRGIDRNKIIGVFFALFTVLMCSDSIFNLLKRVTDGSFLFLCKTFFFFCHFSFIFMQNVFLFLSFLNLGIQVE